MQAGQCYMSEMQCLERYLQQAHTDVQRIEAHKDILSIVLVHIQLTHTNVAAEEVNPNMVNRHLAARQFLAVAVDVALRYRPRQQRHYQQKGNNDAHNP